MSIVSLAINKGTWLIVKLAHYGSSHHSRLFFPCQDIDKVVVPVEGLQTDFSWETLKLGRFNPQFLCKVLLQWVVPLNRCDGFFWYYFTKQNTYTVTLVSVLYLLMSMTWCTPAVETGTSTIKVVVSISSSVQTTLRADVSDHLGQSGSELNHSGPWVHSTEHCSWAGVIPWLSKSSALSVVWQ